MNDPEEAIERVLTGLREAEVPAGMEARILRAMEARLAESASRGWWREWRSASVLAGGLAVAGVVVVVVVAAVVMSMHKPGQVARGAGVTARLANRVGGAGAVSQRPMPREAGAGPGIAAALRSKAVLELLDLPRERQKQILRCAKDDKDQGWVESLRNGSRDGNRPLHDAESGGGAAELRECGAAYGALDFNALAVSEMLAPSKPAPPLPLTNQEVLLARVVLKGDPEQMAELKPEVRAKQVEVSKAEFHEFFEPPPAKVAE